MDQQLHNQLDKSEKGDIIDGTSLTDLISNLPDFKSEMTMLQYRAVWGTNWLQSLKYYPEIAG